MHVTRRHFVQGGLMAGAAAVVGAVPAVPKTDGRGAVGAHFNVHPFIEANPKAVFIRRTKVAHKFDNERKLEEGLALAR